MSDDTDAYITGASDGYHPEDGRYVNITVESPPAKAPADITLISNDARSGIRSALLPSPRGTPADGWSLRSVESYLDGGGCEVTFKFQRSHPRAPVRERTSLSDAPQWAVDCLLRETA